LVVGYSRCVIQILLSVAEKGKRFNVLVNEGRPNEAGYLTANDLKKANIPVKVILDCAIAKNIANVDFVLTGAESVVESGGIINCIGTYNIAIIAKSHQKPFYVASESYKFLREYPICQDDLDDIDTKKTEEIKSIKKDKKEDNLEKEIEISQTYIDFTPPEYITLVKFFINFSCLLTWVF
jgi:translation initiation factor eIF-2B subunit alpha